MSLWLFYVRIEIFVAIAASQFHHKSTHAKPDQAVLPNQTSNIPTIILSQTPPSPQPSHNEFSFLFCELGVSYLEDILQALL